MLRGLVAIVFLSILLNSGETFGQQAKHLDVLITEIFPDPTPQVGLPQQEFVELKNVSGIPFNLKDWRISDGNSTALIPGNYILQPDSIVILCSNPASSAFKPYGYSIGISNFLSLDNEADIVWLRSDQGYTIHAVSYTKAWYQNDMKSTGGWSLEMIDLKNPCEGSSNWKASSDPSGGTPGKVNSINGTIHDDTAPILVRTYNLDSTTIVAVFNEALDSVSATNTSNYQLQNGLQPFVALPKAPLYIEVILKFSIKFNTDTVYQLTVKNTSDCSGNLSAMSNTAKSGLPVAPNSSDIAINEILFNPRTDGFDFIELYNKSKNILDLKNLYVANRNATSTFTNITQVSSKPFLFFPGDYIVLTENAKWLARNYVVKTPENILELSSLPSLPDDEGIVVIANLQGMLVEELHYKADWHFALIENKEGISLERIDYSHNAQDMQNWTSAASASGFATPGYQNSQFKADKQLQGMITIGSTIFSPDGDGLDDFATIHYQMTSPGWVANIRIFDVNGRPVRYLQQNATLGSKGVFRWDGLDDKLQKLPIGIYIVQTEVFNLQGKTKKFKNVLTLAKRL